jgi:serine/threonine protein kinase
MSSSINETDDSGVLPTLNAPPLPSPIGQQRQRVGEYELLERLGRGGMGEVYKARHRRLDKLVALKLLPSDSHASRELAARFQREMKAVGALDHPNVVEAHDAGEQSGIVYLAMKLIDGVDLQRLVKERGPLPVCEACELVRQAAVGLHYLHQRGLIHRDVKPSNLMRTPDGSVKVLDLGLARWRIEAGTGHSLTGAGRVVGTPDFLAPEQIEHAADADARADLYGLGGTLFYLLTGRVPFADSTTLFSKLEAHRSTLPPDLRTLRSDVPAKLATLVHRLLSKNPEERFTTAAELAKELELFVGKSRSGLVLATEEDLQPPHVSAEGRSKRRRWLTLKLGLALRRGSCSLTLALGITALLVGLPAWWWLDRPTVQPEQHSDAGSAPTQEQVETPLSPIHIMALDVKLSRKANNYATAGLLGVDVYNPHLGDTVTVNARLARPAQVFLIAFRADGQVDLCFPEAKNEPSPLTDNPRYPSTAKSAGREYGLTNGVGLQAFAVVVSSKPLPAFDRWWPGEGCPWKRADAPQGMMYRGNGEDPVDAWNAEGDRGPDAEIPGKTAIGQLAAWLRQIREIESVQVLGFVVAPEEKD